jgi:hypothetical protein
MRTEQGTDQPDLILSPSSSVKKLAAARPIKPVSHLAFSGSGVVHQKLAKEVATWPGLRRITIDWTITRAALREILRISTLEELHIGYLLNHGMFENVEISDTLRVLHCGNISPVELMEFSKSTNIAELSIQHARISQKATVALSRMPSLKKIDLEGSGLNDVMMEALSESPSISELWVGASKVGRDGLSSICKMDHLRELDIWALEIDATDLALLKSLRNLNYLSIGNFEVHSRLAAKDIIPRLADIPNLKSIWLDGIKLTDAQRALLDEKYDCVQADAYEDG